MKFLFFSVLAADLAHCSLLCCPRTVEPGRQVLALHAVVLEAQVPQDDWLGPQEVVQRCRVQLLICSSTTPASVPLRSDSTKQNGCPEAQTSLCKPEATAGPSLIHFPRGVFQLPQLHYYKHLDHRFTCVFFFLPRRTSEHYLSSHVKVLSADQRL